MCCFAAFAAVWAISPDCFAAASAAAPAKRDIFHWGPFLAPFHTVVLHMPIGFITIGVILEMYRHFRPSEEGKRMIVVVFAFALLSGIVAAVFGLLRAQEGGYDSKMIEWHRILGIAVPAITAVTMVVQWFAYRRDGSRAWGAAYRLALAGTLFVLIAAGHFGGNLTHGSKYLTEHAPEIIKTLVEDEPDPGAANMTGGAAGEKQRFYLEKVRPILNAKCVSCHGEEKHKGGFRIDKAEFALKGGDSGKTAIKPGDPLQSRLVQLILLPPGHDDLMPPEGKDPLTPEEIGLIVQWVRNGASFGEAAPSPAPSEPRPEPGKSEAKP